MAVHEHYTDIAAGAQANADTFNAPLLTLNNAIVAEETLRATEDDSLQSAYEAADDEIRDSLTVEAYERSSALNTEAAERASADANEEAERIAADTALQASIDAAAAISAVSGGTTATQLARNAGAAAIYDIGSDGAEITVVTDGPHGFTDGDYVTIVGCETLVYNGDSGPIDVTAADEFRYATAVPSTPVAGTGYACTRRLFVDSTAGMSVGQSATVTSDTGALHMFTIAAIPVSGQITMSAAVPATWTLTSRASIDNPVGLTLPEIVAIRTGISSDGSLSAAEAVKWAAGGTVSVRAMGAKGDGATNDRAAIQAALDAAAGSLTHTTVLFEKGEYWITDTNGVAGKLRNSLLISADNVRLLFAPGARLVAKDGSFGRLIIIRNAENVVIEGAGSIVYDRTDEAGQTAINIENSSNIRVGPGLTVDGFPIYGVAITEDTSAATFASSLTSFDAGTKKITAVAASFPGGSLGYQVAGKLTVVGSLTNDGVYTIAAVAGDGSWVQVNETLVTEAAGATSDVIESNTVSFSTVDNTISVDAGGLFRFPVDSRMVISGSGANDGTYTVSELDFDGTSVKVDEPVINEAAGAMITISKVARPSVNVQLSTACNDITVTHCTFLHIAGAALEGFPKTQSYRHQYVYNRIYDCGYGANGGAIKAGQATSNGLIAFNHIAHCIHGILVVNWHTLEIIGNIIHNSYVCGIAITEAIHQKYQASFDHLAVKHNQLSYVKDYESGVQFSPSATNTIDPTRRLRSTNGHAININGLQNALNGTAPSEGWGPIIIANNAINRWRGGGLGMQSSLMPIPNVYWIDNQVTDSANSLVVPVMAIGTVTNGSPTITAVKLNGVDISVSGFYRGIPIIGDTTYIPAGTTITDLNVATGTLTMSANATASGTIGITTTYPYKMQTVRNIWRNQTGAAGVVKFYSHGGLHTSNQFIGLDTYPLQVKGHNTTVIGSYFEACNQAGTAARSMILLHEFGTYNVLDTTVSVGGISGASAAGAAAYIIAGSALSSTGGSIGALGGAVSLNSDNNRSTHTFTQGQNNCTILPTAHSASGLRTIADTAAPVSGAWLRAEETKLTTPSIGGPSRMVVSTAGSPGTHRPTAYLVTQYYGSTTWDPASLANGASASTTVTVTGAAVGDIALCGFTSITAAGWQMTANITSANTASVTITNNTGGTVDLPSGTLRVGVMQPY